MDKRGWVGVGALASIVAAGLSVYLALAVPSGGKDPRAGKSAITTSPSSSKWNSDAYGSHWHGIVGWSFSGQAKSCTIRDDQGDGPTPVDPNRASYPIGSYLSTVPTVTVTVECHGPGGTGYGFVKVYRPALPLARISILRATSEWIDRPAQSHWQILLTWNSNGVDCSIYDDVQKHWFHKDPRGETAGPYGDFARSVRGVGLVFRCTNVADTPSFTSLGVGRPTPRRT